MTHRSRTEIVRTAVDVGVDDALEAAAFPAEALDIIGRVHRAFFDKRNAVLAARAARQQRLNDGVEHFGFRDDTADIRAGDWSVAEVPTTLLRRRVEITGPVDRKMVINALNSGADVFMADFEDSTSPTWANLVEGQVALRDAVAGTLTFDDARTGKHYALAERTAVLMARPRGLHLPERHVFVDGEATAGFFVDAVGYLVHNARALLAQKKTPALYIPKLESMEEAALVHDVLSLIEHALWLPRGVVKVTVLIETLPAAFQMDEILHALKERIVGLNCGRWDYIFSAIKRRQHDVDFVTPDRAAMTMDKGFLAAYAALLVKTCHRRGAFAMGGMSAFIPVKGDADKNDAAMNKVKADKTREAKAGHDGTWVAHPALVEVAQQVFTEHLGAADNQRTVMRDDVDATDAAALLAPIAGERTEAGLRQNLRVGVAYLAAWLDGNGCVPIDNLMEDAATAEIARAQIWQWRTHGALVDGRVLDDARLRTTLDEETAGLAGRRLDDAKQLFLQLSTATTLAEFLTLPAYEQLTTTNTANT
ncbi:MAG TPA: malate synthase A [Myxococcota bacterium]